MHMNSLFDSRLMLLDGKKVSFDATWDYAMYEHRNGLYDRKICALVLTSFLFRSQIQVHANYKDCSSLQCANQREVFKRNYKYVRYL